MSLAQLLDKASYLDYLVGVETDSGLVEDEHGGIIDKSLCHADSLSVTF